MSLRQTYIYMIFLTTGFNFINDTRFLFLALPGFWISVYPNCFLLIIYS